MRVSLALAAAIALAAVAGSASATPTTDSAPASPPTDVATSATATAPSADDSKIICKNIAVTGTRFPTQTCHTKREWNDLAQAARDYVNKATSGVCTGKVCK